MFFLNLITHCTCFEGYGIVGTIATHGHTIADRDEMLDQLGFLIGAHAGVDGAVYENLFQYFRKRLAKYAECLASHGEIVRVLRRTHVYHRLDILFRTKIYTKNLLSLYDSQTILKKEKDRIRHIYLNYYRRVGMMQSI